MSYCVNCGVELDKTAQSCPLCHTPVLNPNELVDRTGPKPFPTERAEVPLETKWALAILISAMLASMALCCGLLNLFLRTRHTWSLYVIGAATMLWIFLVPPLMRRGLSPLIQVAADTAAIGGYVLLIALDLDGLNWYVDLALPIVALLGAILLFLVLVLRNHQRSILSTIALVIGSVGIFSVGLELMGDLYFHGIWSPSWSLVVLIVIVSMEIPLVVVRRVPSLREEARRRFHM